MDEGDLMSVVLGCDGGNLAAAPSSSIPLAFLAPPAPFFSVAEMESLAMAAFDFPDFSMMSGGLEDLFVPSPPPQPPLLLQQQHQQKESFFVPSSVSSSMVGGGFVHPMPDMVVPQPPPPQKLQAAAAARVKRSKKNQQNKLNTQISPYTSGPNDNWAWRKYGQKPIKGYPYPRGYYRCSTVKSCPARKQVEKSWANPEMYIITYSEDHTHPLPTSRNCLAGSIRSNYSTSSSSSSSSSSSFHSKKGGASLSPTTPLVTSPSMDEEYDDEERGGGGMLMVEDMEIAGEDELLFMGGGQNAAASSATSAASTEALAKEADATILVEGEEEDPFFAELWDASGSFFFNGGGNY